MNYHFNVLLTNSSPLLTMNIRLTCNTIHQPQPPHLTLKCREVLNPHHVGILKSLKARGGNWPIRENYLHTNGLQSHKKTWSSVSNSSLSKTFALGSLQNLKFRTSVSSLQRSFSLKFILVPRKILGLKKALQDLVFSVKLHFK